MELNICCCRMSAKTLSFDLRESFGSDLLGF